MYPTQRPLSGLGIDMEPPRARHRTLTRPSSMVELDSRATAFINPSTRPQSLIQTNNTHNGGNMRSAECGAAGVFIDNDAAIVLPGQALHASQVASSSRNNNNQSNNSLFRQGTLLSMEAPSSRKAKELERILVKSKNVLSPSENRVPIKLEQAKGTKARVDVDLTLDSAIVVEGGLLKGKLHIVVNSTKNDSFFKITCPKVRLAGFEEIASDARYIFYHYASIVDSVSEGSSKKSLPCFEVEHDDDGFHRARHGHHSIPFEIRLPIGRGAKGPFKSKQGTVRYIIVGSVKIRSADGDDKAISHFYRHIVVHPYFNPAIILATAPQPISRSTEKSLFMGGSGKVLLSAKIHRNTWVAGQHCYVDVFVRNESSKKVKSLSFSIVRSTIVYRPRPILDTNSAVPSQEEDPDACQTSTTKKKIAEETVDVGKKASKARGVTAKGMWMGVESGEQASFSHSIAVPPDALSINRSRLLEVTYSLKVSVNAALSSDISVELPLQIVNFISIDPPPGHAAVDVLTPGIAAILSDPKCSTKLSHLQSWSVDSLRNKISGALISPPTATDGTLMANKQGQQKFTSLKSPLSAVASPPSKEDNKFKGLRHQRSIDSIGSAIASATARRMRRNSTAVCDMSISEEEDPETVCEGFISPLERLQKSLEETQSLDDYNGFDDKFDDLGEESEDELNLVVQYSKNTADDQGRVSPSSWNLLQKKNSISNSLSSSFRNRAMSSPTVTALSQDHHRNSKNLGNSYISPVFNGLSSSPATGQKVKSGVPEFVSNLPKPKSKSRSRVSSMPAIVHSDLDQMRLDDDAANLAYMPSDPPRPRPRRPLPQIPTYANTSPSISGASSNSSNNTAAGTFPDKQLTGEKKLSIQDISVMRKTSTSTSASSSSAPSSVLATPSIPPPTLESERNLTAMEEIFGKGRRGRPQSTSPPLSRDIVNIEDEAALTAARKGLTKMHFVNSHQMQQRQNNHHIQQLQMQQQHQFPQQLPHYQNMNHFPSSHSNQISPDPMGIQQVHYYGGRTHVAPPPFRLRAVSNNLHYNQQNYQHFASPRSEMSTDDYPAIHSLLGRQASMASFKAPMLRHEQRLRQSGLK